MELRHLRYFQALAEELHFGRAAERLFIAQPGLSRQIKQLETEIGVQLFERNNRRVALTPAGRHFADRTQTLLAGLATAVTESQQIAAGRRGELRIGYIGSAMQRTIPDLLRMMEQEGLRVQVSLSEMDNHRQLNALLAREIDLGFVRLNRVPPPLSTLPVLEDTFSLVLPKGHWLQPATFTGLKQVREEPFILFDPAYSESYYAVVQELFDSAGFAPAISHRTVNASSIYRLVAGGMGLSIVPTVLREGYDMGVRFIELTGVPQRTTLRVVWHADIHHPLLAKVVELLSTNPH